MAHPDHPPGIRPPHQDQGRCGKRPAPVVIAPLTEADVEEAARLYTEVFLADEPTSRRCALDPACFLPHARFYVRSLVGKGLSFVARDERTNEIAGFIFCFDMTFDPKEEGEEMVAYLANFREPVAMIDELEARCLTRAAVPFGSVVHAFQGGVSRKYRLSRVMKALVLRLIAHARERGYRKIVADCTSPASHRVLAQCGFTQVGFLSYDAFVIDGVRFFADSKGASPLWQRTFSVSIVVVAKYFTGFREDVEYFFCRKKIPEIVR